MSWSCIVKSPLSLTTSGATTPMSSWRSHARSFQRFSMPVGSLLKAYGLGLIASAIFHMLSDIQNEGRGAIAYMNILTITMTVYALGSAQSSLPSGDIALNLESLSRAEALEALWAPKRYPEPVQLYTAKRPHWGDLPPCYTDSEQIIVANSGRSL